MFLGMSRGSVGDVTFYRNRGNQVARARNRKPANPKSEAQVIQRMLLATASKAYSRMKRIVDHSFQGIQYGGVSQSYFLKRALEDLRNWVALTLPVAPQSVYQNSTGVFGLAYPTRAALSGVGLLISEGSVPAVPVVTTTPDVEGEVSKFDHFGNLLAISGEAVPSISDIIRAIGAQAGDQITVVGIDFGGQFLASRYVIKADATSKELAENWSPVPDSDAFDKVNTSVSGIVLNHIGAKIVVQTATVPDGATYGLDAAAIIISRKVGDVWQRSTQRIVWLNEAVDLGDFPENVLPEWLAGTAQIDTVNPRYLNQAEQSL